MVTRGIGGFASPVYTSEPGGRPGVLPWGRNIFLRFADLRATSCLRSAPMRQDALEQGNQLRALSRRQILDNPALMPGDFAFQTAQQRATFGRHEQAVAAPVCRAPRP